MPFSARASPEKKTWFATEQTSERVEGLRASWRCRMTSLRADSLLFIDESASRCDMALAYGRGLRGQRIKAYRPTCRGENITMIGALSLMGVETLMTVNGPTTTEVFVAFVAQLLAPRLHPGRLVVMDNDAPHKSPAVLQAIQRTGASVLFLPPYSPDLNPIEECWSKVKHCLRRLAARSRQTLDDAIASAIDSVSPADAKGWFSHAGYL